MKFGVIALGTMGLLGLSSAALAQAETPKARTGFQMDIRTGYSVPLGSYQNGLNLWDLERDCATAGFGGQTMLKLRKILGILRDCYCRTVGVEYMDIQDP